MCANSWTGLISTRGLRKTNSKEKVKRRLSLRRWGISGQTGSIITDLGKITPDSQGLPTSRWLMLYSENQCIGFWRRSRTSRSSNGWTRWLETQRGATRVFIANTIKTKDTLRKNVEIYGTIWNSWSKKESWNSCCTIPVARRSKLVRILGGVLLQDLLKEQSMSSSLL